MRYLIEIFFANIRQFFVHFHRRSGFDGLGLPALLLTGRATRSPDRRSRLTLSAPLGGAAKSPGPC